MRNQQHNFDLRLTWQVIDRVSATVSVPYLNGYWAIKRPNSDGNPRNYQDGRGFGDISLIFKCWVMEPDEHPNWNIQLGVGVEAPTGKENYKDSILQNDGSRRRAPVDRSVQPGDGGWGIIADLFAFYDVDPFEEDWGDLRLYLAGTYLAQPREMNKIGNSVPDGYLAVAGVATEIEGISGLSVSMGGRLEGVPARDVIGQHAGSRRPGYVISVDPSISYTLGPATLTLNVPYGIYKTRIDNFEGRSGDTTYSKYALILSLSVRF